MRCASFAQILQGGGQVVHPRYFGISLGPSLVIPGVRFDAQGIPKYHGWPNGPPVLFGDIFGSSLVIPVANLGHSLAECQNIMDDKIVKPIVVGTKFGHPWCQLLRKGSPQYNIMDGQIVHPCDLLISLYPSLGIPSAICFTPRVGAAYYGWQNCPSM